jgi:hypothetical protein
MRTPFKNESFASPEATMCLKSFADNINEPDKRRIVVWQKSGVHIVAGFPNFSEMRKPHFAQQLTFNTLFTPKKILL